MIQGRRMIYAFGLRASLDTKIVRALRQMRKVFANIHSGLSRLAKFERALNEVALAARHGRSKFALPHEFLHVEFGQLRLRIERINMARAALHQQKNAGLGLCGDDWWFRGQYS